MSPADTPALRDADFASVRDLLYSRTGIVLTEAKKTMVRARLARRLKVVGCASFAEYVARLRSSAADEPELGHMTNCLTTNKTSFFREEHHFVALREYLLGLRARGQRRLRIWSAACSTGQEPYSIAMTLREALPDLASWDARILASDVDTEVLGRAQTGIYSAEQLDGVPEAARRLWFRRARERGTFEVDPQLRGLVDFRAINLIKPPWPLRTRFDVIFCRNVTIYFDRPTQRTIYERLEGQLEDSGLLFAGHSENLHWLGDLFKPAGLTIYRPARATRLATPSRRSAPPSRRPAAPRPAPAAPRRPPALPHPAPVVICAGELHASEKPTVVRTLLGSCVAACLFDPIARVGGMNHFMLPGRGAEDAPEPVRTAPARFGVHAMELLINALLRLGADRRRLAAKVFGAGHVLRSTARGVADANAQFALEFLATEGISVVAQRLGGESPTMVYFHTDTGKALVRVVTQNAQAICRHDELYRRRLEQDAQQATQDVTLF
jgi:chemotaxis protein methyltransferase CheR